MQSGLPHTADALVGRTVRVPSLGKGTRRPRQRVLVDGVTPLDRGSVLVTGNLLYRADNPTYEGSSRGRFVTIVKDTDTVEEEQP